MGIFGGLACLLLASNFADGTDTFQEASQPAIRLFSPSRPCAVRPVAPSDSVTSNPRQQPSCLFSPSLSHQHHLGSAGGRIEGQRKDCQPYHSDGPLLPSLPSLLGAGGTGFQVGGACQGDGCSSSMVTP